MSTTCHKLQMRILQQDGLNAADRQHLDGCADCREYEQLLNRTLDHVDDCEPPAAVDQAILHYARKRAADRRPQPLMLYVKVLASVAALALCVLVGARIYQQWRADSAVPETELVDNSATIPDPTLPEPSGRVGKPESPETVPKVVAEFSWDDDPIEAELAKIEAEFMMFSIDDENAELVSRTYDGSAAE